MRRSSLLVLGLLALAQAACLRLPTDARLAAVDPAQGYRFSNLRAPEGADRTFVILAFSGGGHRAAAFSYGVLKRLREDAIGEGPARRRMLDEVDVISSVSGGSFTAAYYGLFGERIFDDFGRKVLYRNLQGRLYAAFLNPLNWFRLMSPRVDRIHLAMELYHSSIFEKSDFSRMPRRRPLIVVNAADLTLGSRFEFSQEQLDLICSDLDELPVAFAVAASSAFPIALSPVTLRNFGARECGRVKPAWIDNALEDFDENKRRYNRAKSLSSYLDASKRPYIHLLDGGVADNIGLRGPLDAIRSGDTLLADAEGNPTAYNLLNLVNLERAARIAVIAVNARAGGGKDWDLSRNAPSAGKVFKTITGAPMSNYSFETIEAIKQTFDMRRREADLRRQSAGGAIDPNDLDPFEKVSYYAVEVSFDAVADPVTRETLQHLPTSFRLTKDQVDLLVREGGRLLGEAPDYRRLLADLAGEGAGSP